MHKYDPQKAAKVWQRVQSRDTSAAPQKPEAPLQPLVTEALTAAGIYGQLLRRMPGQQSTLRRMITEERAAADCLRGIHLLRTGERMSLQIPAPLADRRELALRRCYGDALRRQRAYAGHGDDPEFGPVFRELAATQARHCRLLLELLGSTPGS